jgi:arginyl-tRNA synthetase
MNLLQLLRQKLHRSLETQSADPTPFAALVRPAQDPRFGDYQANCALSLAKVVGKKPRDLAQEIVAQLNHEGILEQPEIAGPGFINLRFRRDWLGAQLQEVARSAQLGIEPPARPLTLVIDFSSPNVAKPMHVGHLRSTIIGAALARLYRVLGHRVITDNHLGDWGTQFGILLYGYKHYRDEAALQADPIKELARLYVLVHSQMKEDEDADEEKAVDPVAQAARQETARLHAGDPENLRLWRMFMPWCLAEINKIYDRLDVHFDYTLGESFYNDMLPDLVSSLLARGVARESRGAVAIFHGEDPTPALIRKTDGAFTYTTTDLATLRYRMQTWSPDAILYVVDARQSLHFKKLFQAGRDCGYDRVQLEHISFGSVLGTDRRPIKTREGGAVELGALLDEAVQRASEVYETSRQDRRARGEEVPLLGEEDRRRVAEVVGFGAVKYADLSQNRSSDYVFSWEKMLAMDGNTATYMQYAYARIQSIFRKGAEDVTALRQDPPKPDLSESFERDLGLQILRLPEVLEAAAAEYKPNFLTAYLWELAKSYSGFYQNCPVLKAESASQRQSRLLLCDLTARTIQKGLALLGIQTVECM